MEVDHSEDHSESEQEEENELLLLKEINSIEKTIEANQYSYDDHVQLIKLYRQAGDLDGARTARNNMANIFPLSESLWLEWIQDELPLASIPSALQDVKSLFDRAVEDYLSVQIWVEYCSFALDKMSEMGGVDFVRDVFEKAIMWVGLHTTEGGLCWTMYREFEKTVFQSLQEMQANDEADIDLKRQVESQYERIDKLYKRHLGVPVCGIDEVFKEYQSFSDTVITEESIPSYTRAMTRLEVLLPYEQELSSCSSTDSLAVYTKYIEGLKKAKEESTVINVLYQRALADHPLQQDLWTEYLTYLKKDFAGVAPVLLKGHSQAVRNCPWVKDLWVSYVRVQENMKVPHEEIIETFEQSLKDYYSDSASYLELWTCYCDYLRRRTVDLNEGEVNDLRRLFRRAREHLDTYFGSSGDPTDSLSLYQASLEGRCFGNMEEARLLWTNVMKRHGKEAEYWIKYAQLERGYGDISLCRKILLMGVNSASDDPEKLCNELLQFEREQGSFETFQNALDRCASQLARIKERKEKAAEKDSLKKEEKKQQRKERRKTTKETTATGKNTQQPINRRKRQSHTLVFYANEEEEKRSLKKLKVDEKQSVPSATTTTPITTSTQSFVPSTEGDHDKMDIAPPPPPGSNVDKPEVKDQGYDPLRWLTRQEDSSSDKKPFDKENTKKDETVFVSNLTFNTTEDQLRDIFQNCGEISDVRLIKTRRSGSSGNVFAYVEFTSSGPVQQALLLDREVLNHRPMYVSPCEKSTTQSKDSKPKYSEGATVYVTNIAFNTTEEQLQEAFQQSGEIKEVRLVRNRQGRVKGFAYVEYINEACVSNAVMKMDQFELNGRRINVAISKPPKATSGTDKPLTKESGQISDMSRSLGSTFGGKKRISLVPRSVVRKAPGVSSEAEEKSVKKSNEDFRNLLLKKN